MIVCRRLSAVSFGACCVLLRRVRSGVLYRVFHSDSQHSESPTSSEVHHGRYAPCKATRFIWSAVGFLCSICPVDGDLGARGSLLSKANWSKNFQTTITEMIAVGSATGSTAEKKDSVPPETPIPSNSLLRPEVHADVSETKQETSRVGEKRKRDLTNVEVILLDSDTDDDDGDGSSKRKESAAPENGTAGPAGNDVSSGDLSSSGNSYPTPPSTSVGISHQSGGDGISVGARPRQNDHAISTGASLPTMQAPFHSPVASNSLSPQSLFQQLRTSASHSMAIEPLSSAANVNPQIGIGNEVQQFGIQQVVSSNAYDTSNTSAVNTNEVYGINPVMAPPPVQYMPQASQPATVAGQSSGIWSAGAAPQVSGGMSFGNGENGFVVKSSSNMSAAGMGAGGAIGSSSLVPLSSTPGDWSANPLEDALFERYNQINVYTVKLEQSVTALNAHIVLLSTQNIQAAQQLMVTLKQQQQMLQTAQTSRTNALVALIIQSSAIIGKVRRLRMDTLCDIPQVATASHRKCLELSQQVTVSSTSVAALHQQMAITLETASVMSPNSFHQTVLQINQGIQITNQSIRRWKEERENEIVRIVQYTAVVREELKRTFHQKTPSSQYRQNHQPVQNGHFR